MSQALDIPFLNITFAASATADCIASICGATNERTCVRVPEDFEVSVSKNKCAGGRADFAVDFNNVGSTWITDYDGKCEFDAEACAKSVCGLQHSAISRAGGKWSCLSDPAVGQYALRGVYWFGVNGTSPCAGKSVVCSNWPSRVAALSPTGAAMPSLGSSKAIILLGVASGAFALMAGL